MKIVIFGASGMIGQRILSEAASRGHEVVAVARDSVKIKRNGGNITIKSADIQDPTQIAALVNDGEIIVNATSAGGDTNQVVSVANSLIQALGTKTNVRLLVVGGAGSLEVAPGVQLVDSPSFPAAWKDIALAHRKALETYRSSKLNWTYFSPAALIQPGERTGQFRIGKDQLLVDEKKESKISAEDYAVALLDEIESPKHERTRFTAAY